MFQSLEVDATACSLARLHLDLAEREASIKLVGYQAEFGCVCAGLFQLSLCLCTLAGCGENTGSGDCKVKPDCVIFTLHR
jgi:hypothetical protein